ncbi:MAG: hypothetical protein MUQ10_02060 [Anaerolineae bacterium]|nr:hypothetical protein [Anaerolineae bacterium]
MKYRVHHFNMRMTRDEARLADFLNSLDGEVISIIPNVTPVPATYVDFLLIVEEIPDSAQPKEGN